MSATFRKPEDHSCHCPVCGSFTVIELPALFREGRCGKCGEHLWFIASTAGEHRILRKAQCPDAWNRVAAIVSDQVNVPQHEITQQFLDELAADSLDLAEILCEFEDEFG